MLPITQQEWQKAAEMNNVLNVSIYELDKYQSGSEIRHEQFLLLKILWMPHQQADFSRSQNRQKWLSEQHYKKAKDLLGDLNCWNLYLTSLRDHPPASLRNRAFPDLGTFTLVRYHQCQVERAKTTENTSCKFSPVASRTRDAIKGRSFAGSSVEQATPSRIPRPTSTFTRSIEPVTPARMIKDLESLQLDSEDRDSAISAQYPQSGTLSDYSPMDAGLAANFPATEDEQIVNTALILFLNAVTIHFGVPADWTLHRKALRLGEKGNRGFEARVDGFLRSYKDEIKAILEVKPCTRDSKIDKIRMQEGAQMAAWISQYPGDYESFRKNNKPMR